MSILTFAGLMACSKLFAPNAGASDTSQTDIEGATGANNAGSAHAEPCVEAPHRLGEAGCRSAEAFDTTRVRKFALSIAPADRARMPGIASSEMTEGTYVPAQLTIDGDDLGMVGIRFKGSSSLRRCIGADLSLLCNKISYKIKFDAFEPEKRWKGLKKVNLHAMNDDTSLLHAQFAYRLFRAMGIAAPRAAYAQVSVNRESPLVFALTEEVDGRFVADRFAEDGAGNLYKEAWPVSTDRAFYQERLQTNETQPQDHAPFIAFARALQSATRAQLGSVVAARIDPTYMMRYLAVDRVLSNWDGITTFYCASPSGNDCGNHNSYWYVDEAGMRFWLVPWDLDNTWLLHSEPESLLPKWNESAADCSHRVPWDQSFLMAPGCDPLFQGLADLGKTAYRDALADLLAGPFDVAELHAEIDRIATLIRPAVMADRTLDVQAFAARIAEFKTDVTLLREKAESMRDGQDLTPFALRTSAANDFESAASVTVAMGTRLDPNPATVASRSLNREAPLGGRADLRADFEFRTGTQPFTWLGLKIGVEGAPADLRAIRSIRLVLKADRERSGRLELDSSAYTAQDGVRYGWDIVTGPQPTTVTLDIADLAPRHNATLLDSIDAVMRSVTGIILQIDSQGLGADGFFAAGRSDKGFVQLDDIEFVR